MTYYTRKGLAAECGLSYRSIEDHTKAGTCRLDKACQRIPGVGIRYDGALAAKFIAMMQAKHSISSTHVAV